jgi:hypothetical protein
VCDAEFSCAEKHTIYNSTFVIAWDVLLCAGGRSQPASLLVQIASFDLIEKTRIPEPRNLKLESRNPKPDTRNPNPET